ncbi:photosynthetic NDH subunit of lumenal location 3, chloroplastic-like [Malania oleifera]|uniref:photosynthetic NDH subunit of lumenal location 3, chloroplastic-like n=1 Tax=Malania oleifera TaxID=397392 RepID=UPI0025AE1680|nr:photosynthetic NDH subunit of lumenal location 3, chloroplastic-like [Malania oleifera]
MAMDMESRRSAFRIKNCAYDLLSTWENLIMEDDDDYDDDELWDWMQRDLRLKSTFFYSDFHRMISAAPHDDRKESLTQLANKLLSSIQQLEEAVSDRSTHLMRDRYDGAAVILKEVMTLVPPPFEAIATSNCGKE